MKYYELKKIIMEKLSSISDENDREAMLILEYASHFSYTEIINNYMNECSNDVINTSLEIVKRRLNREPLQYILGKVDFFGVEILVSENVLIPRFDTEFVCEKAYELLRDGDNIADICCGSGCIGLSLCAKKNITVDLFDISNFAINQTMKNALNLNLMDKVNIYKRDVFSGSLFDGCEKYNLIISNPPYIETKTINDLQNEVFIYEPHLALDGGGDGLDFYRHLLDICPSMLKENGYIVFEIGYNQGQDIKKLCKQKNLECKIYKDYSGNDRAVIIQNVQS